ncbi:MAG: hypothetical protein ACFFG0_10460 [Candidatus Thorarchaeota archaeon]
MSYCGLCGRRVVRFRKEESRHKTDWEMTIRQFFKWLFTGDNSAVKRKWDMK